MRTSTVEPALLEMLFTGGEEGEEIQSDWRDIRLPIFFSIDEEKAFVYRRQQRSSYPSST